MGGEVKSDAKKQEGSNFSIKIIKKKFFFFKFRSRNWPAFKTVYNFKVTCNEILKRKKIMFILENLSN